MPTVRIDTLRARLEAFEHAIRSARLHLDDLHLLAYDRGAARENQRVRGGLPDYALDNHGDPIARDALRDLSNTAIVGVEFFTEIADSALHIVREGPSPRPRTPRSIRAHELAEALQAQARRRARGEYAPTTSYPQPKPGS